SATTTPSATAAGTTATSRCRVTRAPAAAATARSAATTGATTSAVTARRRRVPALDEHAAPVADVHVDAVLVVRADLPAPERRVPGGVLLGVGHLEFEVVHQDRLPPRRRERRLEGHLAARHRCVGVTACAASLRHGSRQRARKGNGGRGIAEGLDELPAGNEA